MQIAILLDGDFTRRILERKIGHRPSVAELEVSCKRLGHLGEDIVGVYFYDCPPFAETRPLPVSRRDFDFSSTRVYHRAQAFQHDLKHNPFFTYRAGHLSFDGWQLKQESIDRLIKKPGPLTDEDFVPVLSQKQVDMKIGLDVAKLAIDKKVGRILLATSDADFVPAISFARSKNIEMVLVSDLPAIKYSKGVLLKAFNSHRTM